MTRDIQLRASLTTLLVEIQREPSQKTTVGVTESTNARLTAHGFFHDARSRITLSRQLIEHCDRVCQHIGFADSISTAKGSWDGDKQSLQRVLDRQGEKTRLEAHHLLYDARKPPRANPEDVVLPEEEDDLWKRFAAAEFKQEGAEIDVNEAAGWGVAANNHERGVRRVVKNLPEDSE